MYVINKIFPNKHIVFTSQNLPNKFLIGSLHLPAYSNDKVYICKKLTFRGCLYFRQIKDVQQDTAVPLFPGSSITTPNINAWLYYTSWPVDTRPF